jgi:type IV pilus assembly protein PilC
MYPAFVGTIVLSATFFLMIYMVPQLKQFVKNMG